jgi:hypothetical protein
MPKALRQSKAPAAYGSLRYLRNTFSTSSNSVLACLMVVASRFRHTSTSGSSRVPVSSLCEPKCWIFSQLSRTYTRPRVADEPFKKWPRSASAASSFLSLGAVSNHPCGGVDAQALVHLLEGLLCLLEEVIDDLPAEDVVVVIIHFQDLLKGLRVDEARGLQLGELREGKHERQRKSESAHLLFGRERPVLGKLCGLGVHFQGYDRAGGWALG